ncbi:MAG: hypothetical protein HY910_10910 [Desulfarculus sp.]|nr:hypothetical protein [Desulfarculus sp.]
MRARRFAISALVLAAALALPPAPALALGRLFPADNIWNTSVRGLPVHARSTAYVDSIGAGEGLHPDFGSGLWEGRAIGFPWNEVGAGQAKVNISFYYPGESDPGPYPIPPGAAIEGGSDRHLLLVDHSTNQLYEVYDAQHNADGSWSAGSGAVWDLGSNALRPAGWTSADAAGLPLLPGLVRYEEVAAGYIGHALRFTVPDTSPDWVWPARHQASDSGDSSLPPMGQRFRLKSGFDTAGFAAPVRVILEALKEYGMMVADNGGPWYISGAPDSRWNDDVLVNQLRQVPGSAFEAVDVSSLMINPDSAQARQP